MTEMMFAPGQEGMGLQQGATGEMAKAFDKLRTHQVVQVQQKRRLLEAAVGCFEQQNRYVVYDDKKRSLFFVQENSKCWERMCCTGCSPYRLDFHNLPDAGLAEGADGNQHPHFLHIEKPCAFTCLCMNRPEAIVTEVPTNRVLGKIRDPFAFFNYTFQVFDAGNVERLSSNTSCCQLADWLCCPGMQVQFPVDDAEDNHHVATIVKTWMKGDWCPCCFKDWDNNMVHFGEAANPDFKMLLMALSTVLQMRYYDSRNQ